MLKISRQFDNLLSENDPTFKMLFMLARSFDEYIPSSQYTRENFKKSIAGISQAEKPAWVKYFNEPPKTFYEIVQELKLESKDLQETWQRVNLWLQSILDKTSPFIPQITPESAHNIALGHPIAVWLYEYADILDACCAVASVCWRSTGQEKTPLVLLRLPELSIRFRTLVLPIMNGFCKKSEEELSEIRPEYMGKEKKKTENEQ